MSSRCDPEIDVHGALGYFVAIVSESVSQRPARADAGVRQPSRLRTYVAIEALAVVLGYATSTLREGPPKTVSDWSVVLGGAVAVAIPLYLKSRRELRQEAATRSAESLAIEMDTKLHLVLGDVMTPIAEVVGRIHQAAGEPDRSSLRGQLKQLVVEAASHLCGTERTRAIFFELRGGTMRPEAWIGRSDPPNTVFTNLPGDRRGREALALVAQHDFLQVDDISHDRAPLPLGPRPNAGYRALISVAVFSGDQDFGMLTVDAPEAYAFDDTDLNVLRAMAQLLGAGLVERPGTLSRLLGN
jgi:GAF domain-containing protein